MSDLEMLKEIFESLSDTHQEMLRLLFENLSQEAKKYRTNEVSSASRDCLQNCQDAYDRCMANAGSNLEKAVCNYNYSKCVVNC